MNTRVNLRREPMDTNAPLKVNNSETNESLSKQKLTSET